MSSTELPTFEQAPNRRIKTAYFPGSPAATVRESTFSETLAIILGAEPNSTLEDLEEAVRSIPEFESSEAAETAWNAFQEGYVTSGESGTRGGTAQQYIVPFHPTIAEVIKPEEFRNWGQWYRMLMTTGNPPTFEQQLHHNFVDALNQLQPSNIFEHLVVEAAESLESEAIDGIDTQPIPPYIPACSTAFTEDLRAWLNQLEQSPSSVWLRSLRDLICFHYMTYFIQLSLNLDDEFQAIQTNDSFSPHLIPVNYGLWNETASQDRQFSQEWDRIQRALYESWGRIIVLGEIVEVANSEHASQNGINSNPYHISEAIDSFPDPLKDVCVSKLNAHYKNPPPNEGNQSLREAAIQMSEAVRSYYESRGGLNSQAAYTLSYRAVRQLGSGTERRYLRVQRGIGTTSRLDRGALRLFARLFTHVEGTNHIKEFENYLRNRGIRMDDQSYQQMIEQLQELGLIHKQSDSGDAIYVRTI